MKQWFFGADLWKSRFGVMAATCFLTMIWFVVDWCMGTTFRAMSIWELWVNNFLAAMVLLFGYVAGFDPGTDTSIRKHDQFACNYDKP